MRALPPIPALFRILPAPLFLAAASAALAQAPASGPDPAGGAGKDPVTASVVKVYSTVRYPNPFQPWTKEAPREITGSGVVIDGRRILTNAHVVLYASQVEVQADLAGDRVQARVEVVAPEIDLAVLKLKDETFFDAHPALPRAPGLPAIKDAVLVYGFPQGGENLSTTKGIVSRIEFANYNYPVSGLRIQIDAAINPGNSGGPAVVNNRMIGLAFSKMVANNAENIGYIIPNEEIELFLRSVSGGAYLGKPALHDGFQALQNPGLRAYLKADRAITGVVVNRPESDDPSYPLKLWDIVTRIGGVTIDDQGMVTIGPDLRVRFPYIVQKADKGGKIGLTVIRGGRTMEVQVPTPTSRPLLIPDLKGAAPRYFIYGPLAFSAATNQMVEGLFRNPSLPNLLSASGSPLVSRRSERPSEPGEELVVVVSHFPHPLFKDYTNPTARVLKSVNGVAVRNLGQLVAFLRDCKDPYVVFRFCELGSEALVFPRAEAVAATDDILTDNGIRSQASPDLLKVWGRGGD